MFFWENKSFMSRSYTDPGGGAVTYESDALVPPNISDVGVFWWQKAPKKGGLSVTKRTKNGSFSEMHQKIGAFRAKMAQNLKHFLKYVKIFENQIFCQKLSHVWLLNTKMRGLWVTKMCQGLSVTRSLLKIGGHWVKVGKNGGLSVNVSEKK